MKSERRALLVHECITKTTKHFSARTSLAAIGVKVRQLDIFGPIREGVKIAQKTVKHTPVDKLYDGFIAMLAGAQGLVEINTRLRSDRALQAAFDAVDVPSNQWCKRRWMPVRLSRWGRWSKRST